MSIQYFGRNDTTGSDALLVPLYVYWNQVTWTCPGSGSMNLKSLQVYCKSQAAGDPRPMRVGIYTTGGAKIYGSGTYYTTDSYQWVGPTSVPNIQLTGGTNYILAMLLCESGNGVYVKYASQSAAFKTYHTYYDLPDNLPSPAWDYDALVSLRAGVEEPVVYQEPRALTWTGAITGWDLKALFEGRLVTWSAVISAQHNAIFTESRTAPLSAAVQADGMASLIGSIAYEASSSLDSSPTVAMYPSAEFAVTSAKIVTGGLDLIGQHTLDLDASIFCGPSGAYSSVMNLACLAGCVARRHSLPKALSSGIARSDRG
jgi:hypothetical protein